MCKDWMHLLFAWPVSNYLWAQADLAGATDGCGAFLWQKWKRHCRPVTARIVAESFGGLADLILSVAVAKTA